MVIVIPLRSSTYANKSVVNNDVSGYHSMIDNSQEHSTNTVAYVVAPNTQCLVLQAGAIYIGHGAGGINNNHGPGAGGVNRGLGAGSINNNHGPGAGVLDSGPGAESIDAGSINRGVQLADKRTRAEEYLRKYFLQWYKNKNGVLSKQEIKEAFYSLGCAFPDYRTLWALAHADPNDDGCVNITEHEFKALIDYVYN